MTPQEVIEEIKRRDQEILRRVKASRANELTAEYLLRQVPEDMPRFVSQPRHEDGPEYVSPIRFIAGWVVVLAVFGLIWIGV